MIQNFNKRRKTEFCFTALFAILLWLPAKINAQEAQRTQYVGPTTPILFESESTTYTYLTGGITTAGINVDDGVSAALPIGFTFYLGYTPYTTFYASSNGMISFNKAIKSTNSTSGADDFTNGAILAPLWDDLAGHTGAFTYLTTGTAPNRVLTAEWKNWRWRYSATSPNITFQVKIYEGTNDIEYIYKTESSLPPISAIGSIGVFNNIGLITPKQMWLTDFTANPGITASYNTQPIKALPADGQLYRFKQNMPPGELVYYGQTLINASGGTKPMGPTYDGIRINLSGTGNMQIRRKNLFQIYNTLDLTTGTTNPYAVPGTTHGLALSVGNTVFSGGTLSTGDVNTGSSNKLFAISSTQQSLIETSPGHFEDVIKMSATKNGLDYILEVKYTYVYPESNLLIDYKITIPPGNTEKVKLAHGWDTYLEGGDNGPGFTTGQWDTVTDKASPNFVMGTRKSPSYEAFQYLGGVPWDGYYSAYYRNLNTDLGSSSPRPFMTFNKTIDPSSIIDNGMGISIDFGSTPGTYTSNNLLAFACPAGDTAPVLSSTTAKPCTGTTFNLNSYVTSTAPAGAVIQWKNASGVVVADPANVNVAGTYTVSYYSPLYDCNSVAASLTVTYDSSCAVCYKTAVTTGTAAPSKTIISTLNRPSAPRNWSDPRTGSLILESTNRGFVLTRIASPETAITNPIEGMIVYDTVNNVIKLYNGTVWHAMTQQGCPD